MEGLAFLAQSDMEGPQATNVLSDVSLAGDTLSFSMQTQQGSLNVSFELEGDTLSGGLSTPQGNLPIVGKKCCLNAEEPAGDTAQLKVVKSVAVRLASMSWRLGTE